jgi:HAD superfamily hydrolase (TIGR01484 family)
MVFVAFATDYDGTLARDGRVDGAALDSLRRLKASGKKLLLITGRELPSIKDALPEIELFDLVVAENGALLYFPKAREERSIAPAPPAEFVAALKGKGVSPLSIGRSIVATWTPHETQVIQTIRELGLDWQVIFNKGAVMCLPPGVNKASGLKAALDELKLSAVNTIGIGDAENDQAFLALCGCSVAVSNALDPVKKSADIVTAADHGDGVAEIIDRWLDDPKTTFGHLRRHDLFIGERIDDKSGVSINPDTGSTLIAGSSGAGKSRLTILLVERLVESQYQVCIVDPEGDYRDFEHFTQFGDTHRTPAPEEVRDALNAPHVNAVVNLLGTDVSHRPQYFKALHGLIVGLHSGTGRPQWLILDEAHHLSPRTDTQTGFTAHGPSTILVTTHPENLSAAALQTVGTLIAVGDQANSIIAKFCELQGQDPPPAAAPPGDDEVLIWQLDTGIRLVSIAKSKHQHQRHTRKYAQGRLGEDISFFFRGPAGNLNLRAYNLATFVELAGGVDDSTWLFHLQRHDYSQWIRSIIKDDELAEEVRQAEGGLDPEGSKAAIAEAIKKRYILAPTD